MLSEIRKFNKQTSFKSKGKLRYSSKSYHNPFFTKKRKSTKNIRKKIKLSLKAKIVSFTLIFLILFFLWFLFYSKFFTIKNLEIEGRGMIAENNVYKYAEEQLNENFWVFIPQKNIFLFNKKKLKAKLEEKYSFNELNIYKKFPKTIKINYIEKQYKMIWKKGDDYAYADETGYTISSLNILDAKLKDYPIVENLGDDENLTSKLNFIFLLFSELKKYEDLNVEKFILDSEIDTVKVDLTIGPELYFNINKSIDTQMKKLLIIKEEKIKEDFNQKIYIDLRLGDSVYFR
jgi:cell division septal protein FtsQ